MIVYSRILQILGYCNFAICAFFTIYGYIFPSKLEGGTFLNTLGALFMLFASFVMLILMGIFCVVIGSSYADNLISFTIRNVVLYAILGLNLIYRLFFCDTGGIENGSSLTSAKLMAGFAIALILNLSVIIMTTKFYNSYK